MKKPLIIIIFIISAISFITLKSVYAQGQSRYLQGVEFLTGFGRAELIKKKDYQVIPLVVDFDFNLKPLTKRFGLNPFSLIQFQLEPFLSLVTQPKINTEVGTSFLLKLGLLPEGSKFQPYVKAGTGIIWLSQHTLEQSTQFNFLVQGGAGLHYFFKQATAFTLEYRFRHLSNASIKQPNSGIDNHFCLLGITRLF
jgi:hypothetical protein